MSSKNIKVIKHHIHIKKINKRHNDREQENLRTSNLSIVRTLKGFWEEDK